MEILRCVEEEFLEILFGIFCPDCIYLKWTNPMIAKYLFSAWTLTEGAVSFTLDLNMNLWMLYGLITQLGIKVISPLEAPNRVANPTTKIQRAQVRNPEEPIIVSLDFR
jgi:hypothetical protein